MTNYDLDTQLNFSLFLFIRF